MEKLYSIQYLRACAALLVVVAHAFSHQIGVDNRFVVLAGQLGVVLFFVISGFIMVYISGTGSFSALTFLKRRVIRIVPLYWLFTGLAALLAAFAPSLLKTTVFTWPHFLQSLFFIVHEAPGRGGSSPLLSLGWTLNYEAFFYVVFAALAFLAVTSRVVALTGLFVAAWIAGLILAPTDPVLQFYLNASPLAFAAGAWIGRARLTGNFAPTPLRTGIFLAMAVAGGILFIVDDGSVFSAQLGLIGQVLWAVGILVLALTFEERLKRSSLLEKLGDASYALYLSHMFAIGAVTVVAKRLVGSGGIAEILIVSTISVAFACLVGIVVHQVVEKPLIRFFSGRRRRSEKPFSAVPATAK